MPFGVKNAPAVFQCLMQNVLRELKSANEKEFVDVYLDDIIIFSETLEGHMSHLRMVLECFGKVNVKLNPQKFWKRIGRLLTRSFVVLPQYSAYFYG